MGTKAAAKVPMSQRDRKYYVSAAKARWDKERERKIFALAARVQRVLEKNPKLGTADVSVLIAKAILPTKKK